MYENPILSSTDLRIEVIMKVLDMLINNEISLNELHDVYGIKINSYSDRLVLNYTQIDSAKYKYHPIVRECRQLILARDYSQVLHRSFDRFFNLGEDPDSKKFNILNSTCDEKIDGSLIGLYWDGSKWCFCSKSMAFAEGQLITPSKYASYSDILNGEFNFKNVFNNANKNYSYLFELASIYDIHVTKYSDSKLYLLAVRDKDSGEYIDRYSEGRRIGWDTFPKTYHFNTIDEILYNVKNLPSSNEGYVCVYNNWRIKIKNPSHVAIANLLDSELTVNNIIDIVHKCEEDEYLAYFPSFKQLFDPYVNIRLSMPEYFKRIFDDKYSDSKKDFANNISAYPSAIKSILFRMYANNANFTKIYKSLPAVHVSNLYSQLYSIFYK